MSKFFKKEYILNFLISFLFSMSLLLKKEINYNGSFPNEFINNFHFHFVFFIKALLITILVMFILYILFKLIDKIKLNKTNKNITYKTIFLISFIGIFLSGLIFLLSFYPGNIMIDTLYIFKYGRGMSAQHPLFYIFIVNIPFKLFKFIFKNEITAIFLTCLSQLTIISLIISFVITWFNKTFKNRILTILLISYFTLIPIISNYNTTLVKDSLFCIFILALLPILYEIIDSKGQWIIDKKNFILTLIIFSLTCLVRNNGIYIILLLSILLCITFNKYLKKWILLLISVIIISSIPQSFSNKQLFQEKIGVPLQQMAYTIYTDGNISNDDKKFLNKIYDYKLYKKNYNPFIVDSIKWDDNFNREYLNNNSKLFIKTWFNILPNNFESYVKSYLLSTNGLWSYDEFYETQSIFLGIDTNNSNLLPKIKNINIVPNIFRNFYKKTTKYLNGGTCFWILVFISSYIIYKKKYNLLILTIPLYGLWLSLMVSSPFSLAFRYMSPYMYVLPFIIFIVLIKTRDD